MSVSRNVHKIIMHHNCVWWQQNGVLMHRLLQVIFSEVGDSPSSP